MTNNKQELLDCQCCHSDDVIYAVRCESMAMPEVLYYEINCGECGFGMTCKNKDMLIKQWNTRAAPLALDCREAFEKCELLISEYFINQPPSPLPDNKEVGELVELLDAYGGNVYEVGYCHGKGINEYEDQRPELYEKVKTALTAQPAATQLLGNTEELDSAIKTLSAFTHIHSMNYLNGILQPCEMCQAIGKLVAIRQGAKFSNSLKSAPATGDDVVEKIAKVIEYASCHVKDGVVYGSLPFSECKILAKAVIAAMEGK